MEWKADFYKEKHGFVAKYGESLLAYVPKNSSQRILDIGCGTGELTKALLPYALEVIGVDASENMVQLARTEYPNIDFRVMDACALEWEDYFDVVFSNAVFHWIADQQALLSGVFRALKPGGRLVCEFGAKGNTARIRKAFQNALSHYGYDMKTNFFYPSVEEYSRLLTEHGFCVIEITDYERPTPLKDQENGLRNWLRQFYAEDLAPLRENEQEELLGRVEDGLLSALWDGAQWVADYRRLRVVAGKEI